MAVDGRVNEKKTVALLNTAILSVRKNTLTAGYFPRLPAIIYIPDECYGKKAKTVTPSSRLKAKGEMSTCQTNLQTPI